MLGLGNGIIKSKGPSLVLLQTYTSDFTSDVDSWVATDNVEGTLTLAANQTAPGDSAGWLKGTFDTNQSGSLSGIHRASTFTTAGVDYYQVSYKIYLDSPGDNDYWDGTDAVATFAKFGSNATSDETIPQEQVVTVSSPVRTFGGSNATVYIYWASSFDIPSANAVFYIKDVVWKTYKSV